ncbi:hypothetical protein LAZ67_X002737 [Cordylochernes scorpioides]|uniref:Uncharacterized protein n=1 Tax=Cordylochernes scorpioides TaxID=51811 RepID=A0ABY6LXT5_9ARAC|nr:hypothetical protein LAZ67_X002737 [Cordylochernes scorpioides]
MPAAASTPAAPPAPPPSRSSNDTQQEDLTPKPIPSTSALKNLEPKTTEKRRQGPVSRPPSSDAMPSNNSAFFQTADLSTPIKQTPSTPSSPAAPSLGVNIPIYPQETTTTVLPVPAPSTSQLLPRPEPALAIIEPTSAPKKETQNQTAPSIQSSTSMTQPMQPLHKPLINLKGQFWLNSLSHEVVTSEGYREIFVFMNEGLKIHQFPGKWDIKYKGETTPAYITYSVRCRKYHRQGHRRAICPRRDMEDRSIPQATSRQDAALLSPSTQFHPSQPLLHPVADRPTTEKEIQPTTTLPILKSPPGPRGKKLPLNKKEEEPSKNSHLEKSMALKQLKGILERSSINLFKKTEDLGLKRHDIIQAIISLNPPCTGQVMHTLQAAHQPSGVNKQEHAISFRIACLNVRGIAFRQRSMELCCFLKQHAIDVAFVQETNVLALDNFRDLGLG